MKEIEELKQQISLFQEILNGNPTEEECDNLLYLLVEIKDNVKEVRSNRRAESKEARKKENGGEKQTFHFSRSSNGKNEEIRITVGEGCQVSIGDNVQIRGDFKCSHS